MDGTFRNLINPEETQRSVRAIYPPSAVKVVSTVPSPTPPQLDGTNTLEPPANNPPATKGDEGGPNAAGIASGVTVGVVLTAILAFLAVRRRRNGGGKSTESLSSQESGYKKTRDFDPANDLEAGRAGGGRRRHGSDYSSSRDEFSSGDSDSSGGSMQSYSGSESSSSGSGSSYTSSRSSYTSNSRSSRSASDHGGSYGAAGPAGAEGNSRGTGRDDPYEGSGAAVARADALGRGRGGGDKDNLGRLAGSSGTHSNYDDGMGGTSDDSNAAYSQGSSSASYRTGSGAEEDPSDRSAPPTPEGSDKRKESTTTGDDDSSAGSSGWDSTDGDSSVDSGSVETYDLNELGSSTRSQTGTASSTSDSESMATPEQKGGYTNTLNPAVNPVVQRR